MGGDKAALIEEIKTGRRGGDAGMISPATDTARGRAPEHTVSPKTAGSILSLAFNGQDVLFALKLQRALQIAGACDCFTCCMQCSRMSHNKKIKKAKFSSFYI